MFDTFAFLVFCIITIITLTFLLSRHHEDFKTKFLVLDGANLLFIRLRNGLSDAIGLAVGAISVELARIVLLIAAIILLFVNFFAPAEIRIPLLLDLQLLQLVEIIVVSILDIFLSLWHLEAILLKQFLRLVKAHDLNRERRLLLALLHHHGATSDIFFHFLPLCLSLLLLLQFLPLHFLLLLPPHLILLLLLVKLCLFLSYHFVENACLLLLQLGLLLGFGTVVLDLPDRLLRDGARSLPRGQVLVVME